MRVIEHSFSDLLRHPKEVTSDVDDGDVLLRRRDEPDLRLTRADRDVDRASTFAALGRTLRNLAVHSPKALGESVEEALPWLGLLPVNDRQLFLQEFSRVLVATTELDTYAPLSQLIREWRATAEIHADPKLARSLKRPIRADGGVVEPPAV